jgi:hypothetical protein
MPTPLDSIDVPSNPELDFSFIEMQAGQPCVVIWDFEGGITNPPIPLGNNPAYIGTAALNNKTLEKQGTYVCEDLELRTYEQARQVIHQHTSLRLALRVLKKCGAISVLSAPQLLLYQNRPDHRALTDSLYTYLNDAFPNLDIPLLEYPQDIENFFSLDDFMGKRSYQEFLYDYYRRNHPNSKLAWVGKNDPLKGVKTEDYTFTQVTDKPNLHDLFRVLHNSVGLTDALSNLTADLCVRDSYLTTADIALFHQRFRASRKPFDSSYSQCPYKVEDIDAIITPLIKGLCITDKLNVRRELILIRGRLVRAAVPTLSKDEANHHLESFVTLCATSWNLKNSTAPPLILQLIKQLNLPQYAKWRKLISEASPLTENHLKESHLRAESEKRLKERRKAILIEAILQLINLTSSEMSQLNVRLSTLRDRISLLSIIEVETNMVKYFRQLVDDIICFSAKPYSTAESTSSELYHKAVDAKLSALMSHLNKPEFNSLRALKKENPSSFQESDLWTLPASPNILQRQIRKLVLHLINASPTTSGSGTLKQLKELLKDIENNDILFTIELTKTYLEKIVICLNCLKDFYVFPIIAAEYSNSILKKLITQLLKLLNFDAYNNIKQLIMVDDHTLERTDLEFFVKGITFPPPPAVDKKQITALKFTIVNQLISAPREEAIHYFQLMEKQLEKRPEQLSIRRATIYLQRLIKLFLACKGELHITLTDFKEGNGFKARGLLPSRPNLATLRLLATLNLPVHSRLRKLITDAPLIDSANLYALPTHQAPPYIDFYDLHAFATQQIEPSILGRPT